MLERLFVTRYLLAKTKGSVVRIIALISIVGVCLGVLTMVVILSVMQGFDKAMKKRLLGVQPHLVLKNTSLEDLQKVKATLKSSDSVDSYERQDVIIRTIDGIFDGAIAEGVSHHRISNLGRRIRTAIEDLDSPKVIAASKKTKEADLQLKSKEVVLGSELARRLGVWEGDKITIIAPESLLLPAGEMPIYEKVTVKAIFQTDVPDIDSHTLFYNVDFPSRKLSDTLGIEKGYEIRLEKPEKALSMKKELLAKGLSGEIQTWEQRNSTLFYALHMERFLMGCFMALTVLVSSFTVIAVLFLLVMEKRADIGILKSMGATRFRIQKIFVTIGMSIGMAGILGGTIIGLIICYILATYPIIKLPDFYYDTSLPVDVEWSVIFGIVGLGALLTFVGSLLPAWKTAQQDPVHAIRHEN